MLRDRVARAARLRAARRPGRQQGRPAVGRHEAPAHHRPGARERARPAPARRAHHRPRPAGPPPRLGAPLPAQAARASPRCSPPTTWTRPSGSATGSSSWTAAASSTRARPASSSSATSPVRWSSCASPTARPRSPTASPTRSARAGTAPRPLADRVLVYTDDGDALVADLLADGLRPDVGAGAAQHARGRVPDPHRPHPGRGLSGRRVGTGPVLHVVEREALHLPAALARHRVQPVRRARALPAGHGRRARRPDRRPPATPSTGSPTCEFVAPGLMAATVAADRDRRLDVAGDGRASSGSGFYHGMVASPMRAGRRDLGHLGWLAIRLTLAAHRVPDRRRDPRRGAVAAGRSWPSPRPCCAALAVAAPLTAFSATQETDHSFPLVHALPHPAACSCSRARSSRSANSRPAAAAARLDLAAVARRRAVPRRPPPARSARRVGRRSLAHLLILVAYIGAGLRVGPRAPSPGGWRREHHRRRPPPTSTARCRRDRRGRGCSPARRCRRRSAWSSATSSRGGACGSSSCRCCSSRSSSCSRSASAWARSSATSRCPTARSVSYRVVRGRRACWRRRP